MYICICEKHVWKELNDELAGSCCVYCAIVLIYDKKRVAFDIFCDFFSFSTYHKSKLCFRYPNTLFPSRGGGQIQDFGKGGGGWGWEGLDNC